MLFAVLFDSDRDEASEAGTRSVVVSLSFGVEGIASGRYSDLVHSSHPFFLWAAAPGCPYTRGAIAFPTYTVYHKNTPVSTDVLEYSL
jgi:hypothetical protein